MMTVYFKQGVVGDLSIECQKALGTIASYLWRRNLENLYVTSLRDGNHMSGSLHYIGKAFDIRIPKCCTHADIKEKLKTVYGPNIFDILDEGDHIHIEYDPK